MHHRHFLVAVIVGFLFAANAYPQGPKPTAVLTWSSTDTATGTVTFSTSGTRAHPSSPLASWQLTYGDGTNGSGTGVPPLTPSHVYAPGTYTAQLTVVDGQARSASASVNVTLAAPPPAPPPPSQPDGDWTFCATEGGFCTFTGTQQVRYGANGSYFYKTLSDGTACTNSVFGDPIQGVVKQCAIPAAASTDEWTLCALENQTCAFTGTSEVRYGANGSYFYKTLSGGTPCTNDVFGDPIFGTAKQCHIKATALPSSSYGPRPTITCPADAVDIWPGQSIPLFVNSHTGSTTFCLRAGVHSLTSAIRPKTGNIFVGEYGAILDGTGWTTADDTQAAFRAYDDPNDPNDPIEDIDYVTFRNLVIRNMPQYGIHAYRVTDHWTIEYNEIASNKYGLLFASDFTIRNNYIHHNIGTPGTAADRGGGYVGQYAHNTTFDNNEIAWNGPEQKVSESANVTFRNNFVHENANDGIWYDSNNTGALIEGNRVENNGRNGIFFEISNGATIRNNTLRGNAEDGVLISVSQNAQIYNNLLEANVGGIEYFLSCASLPEGHDLQNNAAYDNTIVVGTRNFTYANGFSFNSSCTSAQLTPYLNGSKNLTFSRNAYRVPSLSFTQYFLWGGWKYWNEWQALGHDLNGSISQ